MKTNITTSPDFDKAYKLLKKKYRSLPSDLKNLNSELQENPALGVHLGKGVHKIRVAIKSKGKGKSGGARVISHLSVLMDISENLITLLTIFDKSEKNTVSDKEIEALLKKNGLI